MRLSTPLPSGGTPMIELTKEVKQRVIDLVRADLAEKFGPEDPIVFDPIVIDPRLDPDGEEYLHIYVVYDGDQELLEPLWTADLIGRMWPKLIAMGIPELPGKSFVEKSEWDEVLAERFRESE
jgi:hypothetical protein